MWGKEKSRIDIVGNERSNYKPTFDFDLNSIPFLIKAEKPGVGNSTSLTFRTSNNIPVHATINEDLKPDGKWGFSSFTLGLIGRNHQDYTLTLEVGDNVIQLYFDIKTILSAFQKIGFHVDAEHCQTYAKLQDMVEKSNNLIYLDTVQQMRDRGENI
jgi:hypothetical protein